MLGTGDFLQVLDDRLGGLALSGQELGQVRRIVAQVAGERAQTIARIARLSRFKFLLENMSQSHGWSVTKLPAGRQTPPADSVVSTFHELTIPHPTLERLPILR